jgi:hypothetical protein
MTNPQPTTIALRIDRHLAAHAHDAPALADAVGIRENSLKLLRDGTIKLPLAKIPLIAAFLKVDTYRLLRDVLGEYEPALLDLLDAVWDRSAATPNQRRLLHLYDQVAKGRDCYPLLISGISLVIAKDSVTADSEL